jgi:hypothetical protein
MENTEIKIMKQYIIIDLDRICFDPTDRLERCKNSDGSIEWDRAFSNDEVYKDPVIEDAPRATQNIYSLYGIMYLTARSRSCFEATFGMMVVEGFAIDKMKMRPLWDSRKDYEFKRDRIEFMLSHEHMDFIAAIDADWSGKLKPVYKELGIPCFTSFDEFFNSEIWGG